MNLFEYESESEHPELLKTFNTSDHLSVLLHSKLAPTKTEEQTQRPYGPV